MKCCLIGKTLKHSYSKLIHEEFARYPYDLVELEEKDLENFVKSKTYDCYNVTIPYKEKVMPYLDEISSFALDIGAVNTVVNKNGKLYGYNTDFFGMEYMLNSVGINLKDKNVLILGSGGTCKTAKAVAKANGAKSINVVSRNGQINYQNCYDIDANVVINTTPVGMYPNQFDSPIDLSRFNNLEGVADAIYNPLITKLTYDATCLGVKNVNGLTMLVAQAKFAKDFFLDEKTDNSLIDSTVNTLKKQTENIVLIGMAGTGKTTLAKELAKALNKTFIDTDEKIVEKAGMSIPEIFEKHGEEYFRKIESEVVKEVSLSRGAVIATGGGVVVKKENSFPLKSNGKVVFIKRDLDKVALNGRPLSKDLETVKKMFSERLPKYMAFAHLTVNNNGKKSDTVKEIIEKCGY